MFPSIKASFIDQIIQENLQAQGSDVTPNKAVIQGKDLKTEKVPAKKGMHSRVHSLDAFVHPSNSLGNTNYDYNKALE